MVSRYLSHLFCHCRALVKSERCNDEDLNRFFEKALSDFLSHHHIQGEKDLVDILSQKSYAEVSPLLERSDLVRIFYLVNSFNEYHVEKDALDELGRLKYDYSYIKESGIGKNVVLELMKNAVNDHRELQTFFKIADHRSYFFLSHDIDSVYGSFVQDGLWAVKNKRPDVLFRVFVNLVTLKPDWLNFDLIMKTESEYDFKSTFYWLVNKGKIDQRQANSDYDIASRKIRESMDLVRQRGFENGLHKSISTENFAAELRKMPVKVEGNRFHYLKFHLPDAYDQVEASGLKLDASLGFAEHYGFRNGYGYPFSPFNVKTSSPYSFTEVPLNVMDGTFQRYLRIPVDKTADTIIGFLEKNNQNALISILWHNTFFSNYKHKGYLAEYRKILGYLYEAKFQNINQSGIINEFAWQMK
jgi:hypothetical protein